jgi:hypothetical protein
MDVDAANLLGRGELRALVAPCAKTGGVERVRRDDVHLVAGCGELLGEVSDQNRGAVNRRKVCVRDEGERPVTQGAYRAFRSRCASRSPVVLRPFPVTAAGCRLAELKIVL